VKTLVFHAVRIGGAAKCLYGVFYPPMASPKSALETEKPRFLLVGVRNVLVAAKPGGSDNDLSE
jgi:hypothetical protein